MSSATSYKPTAEEVKKLRERTQAPMMDCRNALLETDGDFERAEKQLLQRGQAQAVKKSDRVANEGLVTSYIHAGGKIGVLVEVNSETDFVARNPRFAELARDLAMHIAAMSPAYIDRDSVPVHVVEQTKSGFAASVPAGKPEAVVEKIIEGKLNKWYEEHCLLDQPFVKDDNLTITELIGGVVGVLGERIKVRRFAKFALGES
ncbi:MAG: translation elongation factor Ts [Candidatus Eremiobacteraeota bacterium]|nr:translation elongation factor Ts [Candidatus Eremiobacteraeota bacterium]